MADGLEVLAKKPDDEHRAHFRQWLLSTHSDPANFDSEALQIYVDLISGPIGQPSLFQHQVANYDPVHTLEISDRLHTLGETPVQLIWGADDTWQTLDWAHRPQQAIPGSALRVIENCGHFAPEQRPGEVAAAILGVLHQHRSWSVARPPDGAVARGRARRPQ